MNVFIIAMVVSLVVYAGISVIENRKIKSREDFFAAGRNAPVFLIAGSLIASYTGVGMFMGDPQQCYDGIFGSIILAATMQTGGYVLGGVLFGRYLRRINALTAQEYFERRFCNKRLRKLASVTAIIMMTVYLFSVMKGIGELVNAIISIDAHIVILFVILFVLFLTVTSGSRGVLVTDSIMAVLFIGAMLITAWYVTSLNGGWFNAIKEIASNPEMADYFSWHGKAGVLYNTGFENFLWAFLYGIVWTAVCMVAPWQSSRYLMAKNEKIVVFSTVPSIICIFVLEFLACTTAVFIRLINPNISNSSTVLIWTAMNVLPTLMGVLLLTGVLAAGVSSATTFLSLIGASFANDILDASDKKSISVSRCVMLVASAIVILLSYFDTTSIFWIMYLGSSIVVSSWFPVVIGSVFSKRVSGAGAFGGMLCGFISCFVLRLYSNLSGVTLPIYFDPSLVGMFLNIVTMVILSKLKKPSQDEIDAYQKIINNKKYDRFELKGEQIIIRCATWVGVVVIAVLVVFWAAPYIYYRY